MSSITYLSFPPTKLSLADQARKRLARLARDNYVIRSLRKRNQRFVLSNTLSSTRITHKMTRTLYLFSASNRKTLVETLKQIATRGRTALFTTIAKSRILHAVQCRLNRPGDQPLSESATLPQAHITINEKRTFRRMILRSIVLYARNCIRTRRRMIKQTLVQDIAPTIASTYVSGLFDKHMYTFTRYVQDHRARMWRQHNVSIIETAWCRFLERRRRRQHNKQRLLTLLSTAHAACSIQEARFTIVREASTLMARSTNDRILLGGVQSLASRLIQRVWRGYRARQEVNRILSTKNRKAFEKLQRERVRKAQAALLQKSPQDVERERLLRVRIEARNKPIHRNKMMRRSELEPLSHHRPPHISSYTGARVMPVSFSKYDKIQKQDAQVNRHNLWVAIPIGFQEQQDGVKKRHYQTQYDWVPATLLERETTR